MSNSVVPDETAHYEPSHLDLRFSLRCLQKKKKKKKKRNYYYRPWQWRSLHRAAMCESIPSYIWSHWRFKSDSFSLRCPHEEYLHPWLSKMCGMNRLIWIFSGRARPIPINGQLLICYNIFWRYDTFVPLHLYAASSKATLIPLSLSLSVSVCVRVCVWHSNCAQRSERSISSFFMH